ncbi:hypothetical protein BH11PLA2_BH11PLA2_03230 [soil metagenome]
MSGTTIFGLIVLIVGMVIAGDPKSLGMKTPSAGIAVSGIGFFIAAFGFYGATSQTNRGGSGRRIRDNSI